jgi:hypothetical protein
MKKNVAIVLFLISSQALQSQDMHYWTRQFGTRASLLGGTVVGGIGDNTAIFYNPAALAFMDSGSVSVDANLYQIENVKLENAAGDRKDVKSSNLASVPLLLGGKLKTKIPNLSLGYGIINQISFAFNGGARVEGFFPIVNTPESPGNEEYTGQVGFDSQLNETTGILALGYRFNDNLSIGLSNFISVRGHTYQQAILTRMYLNDDNNTLVSITDLRRMQYSQISYIPKLGINWVKNKWSWGATLTLPNLRVMSNASVTGDLTGNNVDLFDRGRINFTASDAQQKLSAKYRNPLSVAFGGVYKQYRTRFTFTGQYFAGNGVYEIISPNPDQFLRPEDLFPNQTSDKYLRVVTASKSVFNAGVGFERDLTNKLTLSGSFRTDFSTFDSALNKEIGIKPHLASWDIYHLTGGITYSKGRSFISLGLSLSMGNDNNFRQSANLDNPSEGNFLQGQLSVAKARYFASGIILGYTFFLLND